MIENTSKRQAAAHLLGLMADGSDRYITDMEAAGQRQMVASEVMPTDAPWDELAALGFQAGEVIAGDPIFRHVALPEGWRKEGSDHDMWSYIVDADGVQRVAVFYKAAFYDRRAFARIETAP